jgi:hypothetical protein
MSTADENRAGQSRTWIVVTAWAALVLAVLLLLSAGGFLLVASTGDGWAFLGYYYSAVIAVFEVPAVVLAVVALVASKGTPGRGRVVCTIAALFALGPLLLWGLLGLLD